jgi:hypothetical protein
MTQKVTMLCAIATIWCTATALKAALALAHRESYVVSWWDAGIVGTGRKLGRVRTFIKLVTMLAIATVCALALAQVLLPSQTLYTALALIGVTAVSELSTPKPQRGKRSA